MPCFFPSISSIKTNLQPVDYLEFLVTAKQSIFLISAYDVSNATSEHRNRITQLLSRAAGANLTVLLDSGNYEAFWKGDSLWSAERFHQVCGTYNHGLCFCYDNQTPHGTSEAISQDVVASVLRDQASTKGAIIPIVHGTAELLPVAARRVAGELYPLMIAVPERALGEGILARAATARRIRTALDDIGVYMPIHLLGTGNPLSILVYALAGADSFDGLEWCQTVVDHRTGRLHHFQHWDFFADQTPLGRDRRLPYIQSVLLHNLVFYNRFMAELAEALVEGNGEVFARKWLSAEEFDKVAAILMGVRE